MCNKRNMLCDLLICGFLLKLVKNLYILDRYTYIPWKLVHKMFCVLKLHREMRQRPLPNLSLDNKICAICKYMRLHAQHHR